MQTTGTNPTLSDNTRKTIRKPIALTKKKPEADRTHEEEADAMNDSWSDVSTFRCETCMFFVKKGATADGSLVGRCRRHAPTMGGYPVVYVTDFCGDHKLAVQPLPAAGAR